MSQTFSWVSSAATHVSAPESSDTEVISLSTVTSSEQSSPDEMASVARNKLVVDLQEYVKNAARELLEQNYSCSFSSKPELMHEIARDIENNFDLCIVQSTIDFLLTSPSPDEIKRFILSLGPGFFKNKYITGWALEGGLVRRIMSVLPDLVASDVLERNSPYPTHGIAPDKCWDAIAFNVNLSIQDKLDLFTFLCNCQHLTKPLARTWGRLLAAATAHLSSNELQEQVFEFFHKYDEQVWRWLAISWSKNSETLERAICSMSTEAIDNLSESSLRNRYLSPSTIEYIYSNLTVRVRRDVLASSSAVPEHTLYKWASSKRGDFLFSIVSNPNASERVLLKVLKNTQENQVLIGICNNSNVTTPILVSLLIHDSVFVRKAAETALQRIKQSKNA